MGLLEIIRRADDDGTLYECRNCGATAEPDVDECTECGSAEIACYTFS